MRVRLLIVQRFTLSRPQRWLAAVLGVPLVTIGLAACGTERSVEAYCETMETHKQRYLEAMELANAQAAQGDLEGVLAGLGGGISAIGDLAQMWDELAEVAPDDIRADVETVRDSFNKQLEGAVDDAGQPLRSLASSLAAGLLSAGSWSRVDQWTADNCGVGGAALGASDSERSSDDESAASEPADAGTSSVGGPGIDQPIELSGEWLIVGDVLLRTNHAALFLPGHGVREIDTSALLPGEDVVDQRITVTGRGDSALLVAVALVRAPAQGLNPASLDVRVLAVEPVSWTVVADNSLGEDLHDGGDFLNLTLVPSPDGLLLLSEPNTGPAVAIDPSTGNEIWRDEGTPVGGDGTARQQQIVLLSAHYETSQDWLYCSTYSLVNVSTGNVEWRLDPSSPELNRDDDECPDLLSESRAEIVGGRYISLAGLYDGDSSFTIDGTTGEFMSFELSSHDHVDPVTDLVVINRDSLYFSDAGIKVVNTVTTETLLDLDEQQVSDLQLWVYGIYNEKIYVETTDGQPIIDVHTGDAVGEWTTFPIGTVGDWTVYTDQQTYTVVPPADGPAGSDGAAANEQLSHEGIDGVLRHERAGVEGVTLRVTRTDGSEVGTAETDVEGRWRIAVPEPGEYVVTLDVSTLPEGVPPPTEASIITSVGEEQERRVGFRLQ